MNFHETIDLIRLALDRAVFDQLRPEQCLTHLDQAKRLIDDLSIDTYRRSKYSGVPYKPGEKE